MIYGNSIEGTNSRFEQIFSAYSKAFRSRDDEGLKAAFHPEAIVRVHDRRKKEVLTLTPQEFFTRLYREIGDAEFRVETLKARFDDGYLFADGVWITEGQKPILRAADLFSALEDGRVSSLTVVWTDATTVEFRSNKDTSTAYGAQTTTTLLPNSRAPRCGWLVH